jgi:uncharacterized protein
MRRTAASLFAIAGLAAAAAAANAQSFNCGSARYADEHVICKDPSLSKLDEQLSAAFANTFDKLPRQDQKELADDEDDWVASRHQCGADSRCIAEEYRNRIRELTGAPPPPSRLTLPAAGVAPREPAEATKSAPPPTRQSGPEPLLQRPHSPVAVAQPPGFSPPPPFPVVERPPQPPFPVVERPLQPPPVAEGAPSPEPPAKAEAVEPKPPPRVVEQQPSAATEQHRPAATEPKSQTKVTVAEPPTPERRSAASPAEQPSAERRKPQSAEPETGRRQQADEETRPPLTTEREPPPTSGSASLNPVKPDRPERKSTSHEVRRTTAAATPISEPVSPERASANSKPAARHHKAKQDRAAAAASAAAAAAPAPAPAAASPPRSASAEPSAGSSSVKPSIQWVDPPPAR